VSRKRSIERRQFIQASSALLVSGLGSGCQGAQRSEIEAAARKIGELPRHELGSSGRKISVLVGAGTWAMEAVDAGLLSGINFWHKANSWWSRTPQAILKNRDAHYCQVCVDRVRGNHETGEIDEDAHYRFVKQAIDETGLRYFDDMQFHFGYHSVAELKKNRAFVRAFERLKKEGLVRHLCLSQHSYNGNWRVRNGDNAFEILTAIIEDGVYEHAQFFYSYGDIQAANDFVALAKRRGFGTIAMKTTRGAGRMSQNRAFMKQFPAGTTPYQALTRWLTTSTDLDAAVIQINGLRQFVDTFSGAGKSMRTADVRAIRKMTEYADREVCRLCNECMEYCMQGVAIADILRYERYARDNRDRKWARQLYAQLDRQGDSCIACGSCLSHCSQGLRIPKKLLDTHKLLA
jgi:predicted aldo/keto reductase-like oxidoreductase